MLSCGCEPCFEGGYGDDGLSGRYSMEWCPLHKHAEALREALERVPDHPHAGMCQFRPSYSQLGSRPCTCYIGKIQAALALVTGGRDA